MLRPWETKFFLESSSDKTFHAKLLEKLITDIKSGRLSVNSMLPGSRSLANQLGVNRKTVQQVYEELESQGWLVTKPRCGTFVADIIPEQDLSKENKQLINNAHKSKSASLLVENLYKDAISINNNCVINDGTPDTRLIPYEILAKAYRRACIHLSRYSSLGYEDPRGIKELRESIQTMLSKDRFMNCSLEQICVVRGSQMGIYLASRILDPKKGAIIVEEMCYLPAKAAFESNGFKILSCKLDDDGLNILALKELIAEHEIVGIYVTPHHQYPTTVTLPIDRRLELLNLSKQHQFVIIEDDYDHEFHYENKPIPPLASLPNSENVIHIGSMSKVFAPGLRLGYISADQTFIERAAQEIVLIDRQGNTITEHVLSELMKSGEVKKHIRKTKKQYETRRNFAANEFKRVFGNKVSFKLPIGGMALWINIEKMIKDGTFNNLTNKDATLSTQYSNLSTPTHLRFGFGAITPQEITKSIEDLSINLKV
ncbi:PLP-dependent aminotransferase family protein [Psychromonas sp. GE-S-Ul-11]|uniref:MocR-like pyridoxine biosynthesis transcription factor PdxR n=1 Tax=Psychromonas sp. GE-S-Ul-11 TaxID=3241170 RepID=UPI00390C91BC